jgi:rubredoxin
VTLGQYTRALAEGYSKRSTGVGQTEEDFPCFEVTESASKVGRLSIVSLNQKGSGEFEASLSAMDGYLAILEDHGRRWRQRYGADTRRSAGEARSDTDDKKKRTSKSWLPVFYSSSFAPVSWGEKTKHDPQDIRLIAMWSRTRACRNCAYIPLEEEVQAGWDVVGGENEVPGAIACPRCGSMIVPMLGIEEISMEKALALDIVAHTGSSDCSDDTVADFAGLPPQIGPTLSTGSGPDVHYVAYRSPSSIRLSLEQHVEEHGEEVLVRDRLLQLDPEVSTTCVHHSRLLILYHLNQCCCYP